MFEVNQNSWHWRVYKATLKEPKLQTSLCAYFWRVCFGLVMIPIAAAIMAAFLAAAAVTLFLLSIVLIPIYFLRGRRPKRPLWKWWAKDRDGDWNFDLPVFDTYWRKPKRSETQMTETQPGLFVSWVKAKKQKVCPILKLPVPGEEKVSYTPPDVVEEVETNDQAIARLLEELLLIEEDYENVRAELNRLRKKEEEVTK